MKKFNLPDPGEGLVEAEIVSWRVAVGDQVKVNDIVVEIETSKSLVELPIPWAGTVAEILVPEGETVDVGTPIVTIDDGSGAGEPSAPDAKDAGGSKDTDQSDGEERVPNLVGYGAAPSSTRRRARRRPQDPGAQQTQSDAARSFDTAAPVGHHTDEALPLGGQGASEPQGSLPSPGTGHSLVDGSGAPKQRPRVKPPLRKYAKNLGVDLDTVTPSGPDGIITRDDIRAAAEAGTPASAPVSTTGGEEVRIPIKGVRKATAAAMVSSAFTAPHVTEWVEVDVTESMEFLARLRKRREFAEVKLSPTVLVARAVCLAVAANPEVNASWDEANQEIVLHPHVNLGIAAATPRGLVVPNIKSAETMGIKELAEKLTALVTTARSGKTQPADMSGGTLTITNIGVFGVDAGTPILNPGEAMIVATGQIARKPWVIGSGLDERVEARDVMTLSCSFDHRLVDGEQGSKFLARVAGILADPALAML